MIVTGKQGGTGSLDIQHPPYLPVIPHAVILLSSGPVSLDAKGAQK